MSPLITLTTTDIEALKDLRDHLTTVTESSLKSGGLTYTDEIKLLDRVIYALEYK